MRDATTAEVHQMSAETPSLGMIRWVIRGYGHVWMASPARSFEVARAWVVD